jgi:8-oxo-dGTP pyrophosphatase MutT (NUDIX family)
MSEFARSYLGRLRQIVGSRLILMPGARLVLWRPDRMIFLQKRSDFGKWGLIAGSPEEGESLTDTIVREAMEETGIKIERPVPFGFSSNPSLETTTYPNGDRCQFFAVMYACDTFTGEPRINDDESTDVQWFDIDDLPSNCMPSVAPTLAAVRRWRHTGQFQNIDGSSSSTTAQQV